MSHLERLCAALLIIFISLAAGYCTRRIFEKKGLNPEPLATLRKRLQALAIFVLLPVSAMFSLWGLPAPGIKLLWLPFLGLASYIANGLLALAFSRPLKLTRIQTGSFFCCGSFTNLGAVGSLVCLIFLGENTIALVALYRLLEDIYYFGAAFPIARRFSPETREGSSARKNVYLVVPVIIAVALGTGIALNFGGIPRPGAFGFAASGCMILSTVFFLYAIGLSLHLSKIGHYLKPGLAMCAIKFIASPLLITSLAALLGLGLLEGGLPLKTVLVLSAMPVAMTALVPPSLFDLDLHLANSCWIISTLGLFFILPALLFLLPLI